MKISDFKHIKIIACATVIEEMRRFLPPSVDAEVLDYGLHLTPDKLRKALQQAIDEDDKQNDAIVLGYGLCSMAVVGLTARNCTLVVPKVDDCIAIFLGSTAAYRKQAAKAPGTYYLTKGWIEVGDSPFEEYNRLIEKYGKEKADKVMAMMLKHYSRLAYIDTGRDNKEKYTAYTKKTAEAFNLHYEEIPGSSLLIKKMINGPWDEDFIIVPPGKKIEFGDFRNPN